MNTKKEQKPEPLNKPNQSNPNKMAKRFTETEKWKRQDYRSLSPELKLFYNYLQDSCDHAGFWEQDLELAKFQTGIKSLDPQEVRKALSNLIQFFVYKGRTVYFLKEFIFEQYGANLNPQNKVHRSVLSRLDQYGMSFQDNDWILTHIPANNIDPKEGLLSPIDAAKDKDKEKDKDIINTTGGVVGGAEYKQCIEVYSNFMKSDTGGGGAPFMFGSVEGAYTKRIIEYLSKLDSVKNGSKTPSEVLAYIFSQWASLEPFYQKQIKLQQIYSNLPNIIRQLNPKSKPNGQATTQLSQLAEQIRATRGGSVS